MVLYRSTHCIEESLASLPAPHGAVLVENLPGDGSSEAALRVRPDAKVIRPGRNLGFGGGCNLAFRHSTAPYLLLLNPDASLHRDCLDVLVAHMEANPRCGAAGPLVLRSTDGTIDSAGMERLAPGWTRDRNRGLPSSSAPEGGSVQCLSAGVLLLRRSALEDAGRFPDAFWTDLFLYSEDVELSFALHRRGWDLHFEPRALAFHAVGGSNPPRRTIRAMSARNRLLTGMVHSTRKDLIHLPTLLRWAWRITLDLPRLVDNFLLPELRRCFWSLVGQVGERRRNLRTTDS
ncbi:MAG TPA: glycosyltransferase family 2 protein [Fibrobacteria bacterium]|nr:glycosyltransferase family 2 protein [Fibrobacteria bacterium]